MSLGKINENTPLVSRVDMPPQVVQNQANAQVVDNQSYDKYETLVKSFLLMTMAVGSLVAAKGALLVIATIVALVAVVIGGYYLYQFFNQNNGCS